MKTCEGRTRPLESLLWPPGHDRPSSCLREHALKYAEPQCPVCWKACYAREVA